MEYLDTMDESPIKTDFNPTKLIVLSELPTKEKEKYYQLLLLNQARFVRDNEGRYIASLRLLAPGLKKVDPVIEKKKKDAGNYALTFQERLTKLRQEGFITVQIVGVPPFEYNAYPRFTALIASSNETVRPKLRPLSWVMKLIEDIYDHRFAHEKHDVEREDDAPSFDLILLIFPVFVVRRLGTRVGLKSLVDQTCWDLLYSVHLYRQDYLELEIFARFLQEFYDHDDLLFYLYVRSVISKVLHINFKQRWQKIDGPGRQFRPLWMSYREAAHVARVVFGTDNEEMFREFMALITPQMIGERNETHDSRRIDITEYLHLSVVGYHQSQGRGGGASGGEIERLLVPIPGQTAPPEPVPLPPSMEEFDRMRQIMAADQAYQQQMAAADVQHQGHQPMLDDDYMANAYDLEDEQYDDFLTSPQQPSPPQPSAQEPVHRGSGKPQSLAQALSVSQLNHQHQEHQEYQEQPAVEAADNYDPQHGPESPGNFSEHDPHEEGGEPNPFEEQQQAREMEFMSQLCAPLMDAPQELYQYVEAELWERLHRTVSEPVPPSPVDEFV